jgi:hypothetical protein
LLSVRKGESKNKGKFNFLDIKYQSSEFPPQEVYNQLIMLLSGKSIAIYETNFQIFQEIFNLLGNRDLDLYFNKEMPKTPTDFYLSIHSLKDTDNKFYESSYEKVYFNQIKTVHIPTGIFHLFFSDESKKYSFIF